MIHGRVCMDEPCDYCQNLAEDRAYDIGHRDDWQLAQTQYERHLDRLGEHQ
jgi:hypothetical protein